MKSRFSSLSPALLGVEAGRLGLNALTSTPWPTANRALFLPFSLDTPGVIPSLAIANGSTIAGHVDAGVYNNELQRLASARGVKQFGNNSTQQLSFTQIDLTTGAYWLALVFDNAASTLLAMTGLASAAAEQIGLFEVPNAYPLPATVTPSAPTMAILPLLSTEWIPQPLTTLIADRIAPAWQMLSAAQHTAWHVFAVDNPWINSTGDFTSLSAFGMYVAVNSWLAVAGMGYILQDPPPDLITPQSFNLPAQVWPIKSKLANSDTDRSGKLYVNVAPPLPLNRLVIVLQPSPFISAFSERPWPRSHSTVLPPGFSGLADLSTREGYSRANAQVVQRLKINGPYLKGHPDQRTAKILIISTQNGMHVEGSILNSK